MTLITLTIGVVGLAAVVAAWDAMRRAVALHRAEAEARREQAAATARQDILALIEEHRADVEKRLVFVEARLTDAGLVAGLGRRRS